MDSRRDFSTISPSAKGLLVMKSRTGLPYAKEAADLLWGERGAEAARAEMAKVPSLDRLTLHFENRYRSLDEALRTSGATSIIEIASGLSFRGLAMTAAEATHYVDTDLPEMAATKAELVAKLQKGPLVGTLRVMPLNALDGDSFAAAVDGMPPGPITVIHEGLLVYLDDAEKTVLAANVRDALLARGGAWITADVYVRRPFEVRMPRGDRAQRFLDDHHVEEQKFADWGEADAFFTREGFAIERKLSPSSDPRHSRETWVLVPRA
ncbi:MAG TPA: class I SAM-dependent methyltransferase [Polyangiaceae bacterium]|jgi:O-methyltransferase involved in polyketide biosynthesis